MKAIQRIRKTNGEVEDRDRLLRWFSRYLDRMPDGEQLIEFIETSRTDAQNKYYWVILGIMAQEFGTTAEELHEYCKAEFLPTQEWFTLIRRKQLTSTTEQSKNQMSDYIERVIQFAAENGIALPDLEEYKHSL